MLSNYLLSYLLSLLVMASELFNKKMLNSVIKVEMKDFIYNLFHLFRCPNSVNSMND